MSLILEGNKMGSEGVKDLCDRIVDNTTLLSINMASCNLRHTGGFAISQYIKKNPALETLDLKKNGIKSDGILPLAEALVRKYCF